MRRLIPSVLAITVAIGGLLLVGCQDSSLTGPEKSSSPSATTAQGPPGGGGGNSCTVTLSSDIQSAVDGASSGDVVCVEPGTYEESVAIDVKDLTLRSTEAGAATIVGQKSTAVSIEADGVTVKDFTVTNPDRLLGIKVERDFDGATIENNTVEEIGPTGRLGVTGIIVGQGDHDDIEITNNVVQNLDQETTEETPEGGFPFPTVNGILFDADNDDQGLVTDVAVNNNTIREVESDVAPLGIVVQHETDGVDINNNVIKDFTAADDTDSEQSVGFDYSFTFAQGINIASPATANTVINHNVIKNITSAEAVLPEAVKIDGNGEGLKFRANQFKVAIGLNNRNGEKTNQGEPRDPSGDPVIDAKNNYWGSSQGPEEADFNQDADDDSRADVVGKVNFEPFLRNPPGNAGNGPGGPPQGTPGNGPGGNPGGGPGN